MVPKIRKTIVVIAIILMMVGIILVIGCTSNTISDDKVVTVATPHDRPMPNLTAYEENTIEQQIAGATKATQQREGKLTDQISKPW